MTASSWFDSEGEEKVCADEEGLWELI